MLYTVLVTRYGPQSVASATWLIVVVRGQLARPRLNLPLTLFPIRDIKISRRSIRRCFPRAVRRLWNLGSANRRAMNNERLPNDRTSMEVFQVPLTTLELPKWSKRPIYDYLWRFCALQRIYLVAYF